VIEPYFGEFLISPIPLELSLNYCSHKCAYCFANLNKPDRRASMTPIMNLLRDYRNRDTLQARLLQAGYPVLFSNKVDPFAASNYKQALPIARTLVDLDIPIAWQTKGGRGLKELLPDLPPGCWYVSISFNDDELRKRIEHGATTLESRYELIQQLVESGHSVNVGINPLVPEWLPEPEPVMDRLKALGVHGVWIQTLHLNYRQRNNLSNKERSEIGEELIKRSMKRNESAADVAHVDRAGCYARSIGLETFSVHQPHPSKFFSEYPKYYKKLFPTNQDLVNAAFERLPRGEIVDFENWYDLVGDKLPSGVHPIDHYIGATARDLFWSVKIPKRMTYRQLLGIFWHNHKCHASPMKLRCFSLLSEDEEHDVEIVDPQGLRYLVFRGNDVSDEWYVSDEEARKWRALSEEETGAASPPQAGNTA
jgi:DNA repair photolyase